MPKKRSCAGALAAENRAHALILMIAAASFIAATTRLAKALGTDTPGPALPPLQISHGRFIFAWCAIAAVVVVLRRPGAGAMQFGAVLALGAAVIMGLELIFIKRRAGRETRLRTSTGIPSGTSTSPKR